MSRRLAFLTGHLSGLLLGAMLVFVLLADRPDGRPVLNLAPGKPMPVRVSVPAVPDGGELRHFNGCPYYIVPAGIRYLIGSQPFGGKTSIDPRVIDAG